MFREYGDSMKLKVHIGYGTLLLGIKECAVLT